MAKVNDPNKSTVVGVAKAFGSVFGSRGDVLGPDLNPVVRDNTRNEVRSVSPEAREMAAYYNPPVRDVSSGDRKLDLLYRNQWLMGAPVIGGMIRNAAYNVASNSDGVPVLDSGNVNVKSRGEYSGQDLGGRGGGPRMLDIYFGKEKPDPSLYKPTSDYLEFLPSYSVKRGFDEDNARKNFPELLGAAIGGSYMNSTDGFEGKETDAVAEETISKFLKDRKPVYLSVRENTEFIDEALGVDLGGHKMGLAWDEEVGLPYMSISDAWDFEPRHYSEKWDQGDDKGRAYVQSSLMHKAGKPFKIYDRFYFDPKTREYIPDSDIEKRKSK